MRFTKAAGLSLILLALASCATVQSLTSTPPAFPPIEPGKGRVFIYRSGVIAFVFSSDTSDVMLNGEKVGKAHRTGVSYRDVKPGSYALTTSTTSKIVFFHLDAGEKKYVRLVNAVTGSYIFPELVDAAKGESEVSGLERLPR
jgi:hypothetical protein